MKRADGLNLYGTESYPYDKTIWTPERIAEAWAMLEDEDFGIDEIEI